MSGLAETCSVTLRAVGSRESEGVLVGHPASPTVRTRRTGDLLAVEIILSDRIIGTGSLRSDQIEDAPAWQGEIAIDGATWWASSLVGTGIITLSAPRRPLRGAQ
jgi:hypothetical protein